MSGEKGEMRKNVRGEGRGEKGVRGERGEGKEG